MKPNAIVGQRAIRSRSAWHVWSERPLPKELLHLADGLHISSGLSTLGLPSRLRATNAIIASVRVRYDARLMAHAPNLRVITRTGAGIDNIELPEATRRGIAVCNIPDGPTVSTAEHTVALLLAAAKRLKAAEQSLLSGQWEIFNSHAALELDGRCLGVLGLGKVGSRVARACRALGMRVVAYDPNVTATRAKAAGVELESSMAAVLRQADVVTIHVPLTAATYHLIDARALGQMRHGAILVNTARGGIVDEAAVCAALDSGRLSAVALDVFDPEPPLATNRLLGRADVVATPHVAAATQASRERLWRTAIQQVVDVLSGRSPAHIVNPEALTVGREETA